MSIRESSRAKRDRWPLEFDLAGIPQDEAERERLLKQVQAKEPYPMPVNSFAVDRLTPEQQALLQQMLSPQMGEQVIDINNPKPNRNYNPHAPENQFPRMVYHHGSGAVLTISSEKELKAATKRGYELKPAPGRDYSKARNGVAPVKETGPAREQELSAEALAELDEEDES